ncbi:hypothetical protein NE398_16855 [Clostridium tertium]|uniref:Anthrax toxin lethal/endema factor N-/C-terminal domain-containing protein n=1 Tax=Clostridium tertium TaxID=1559 RepID=A0A9X4B434_9CLOT|nr:hypothetical protein [Clostridium tertium]MDC4241808.1 hypothetical protein [Clostridium tertium]
MKNLVQKKDIEVTKKCIKDLMLIYPKVRLNGIGDIDTYNRNVDKNEIESTKLASFIYPKNIIVINYKNVKEYGRKLEEVIYHEFGHAIDFMAKNISLIDKISNDFRIELKYKEHLKYLKRLRDYVNKINHPDKNLFNMKTHAETNLSEYFAECFVYYYLKGSEIVGNDDVINLVHTDYSGLVGFKK